MKQEFDSAVDPYVTTDAGVKTEELKHQCAHIMMHHFPRSCELLRTIKRSYWKRKIFSALNASDEPNTCRAESDFEHLQTYFDPPKEYGYGKYDVWRRGVTRAAALIDIFGLKSPGAQILEVGCGDGMAASELSAFGHDLTMTDLEDWRDRRVRSEVKLVIGAIEEGLPIERNKFDLVYSYNTFEHVRNPELALHEMLGRCRVGGHVYLDFGPLFASPWGLHAYRSLKMPYPQFLFSPEFIAQKLSTLGIKDLGTDRTELQPLNRWRLTDFRAAINSSGGKVMWWNTEHTLRHLPVVQKYREAFRGRGLSFDDLTHTLIRVIVRRTHE